MMGHHQHTHSHNILDLCRMRHACVCIRLGVRVFVCYCCVVIICGWGQDPKSLPKRDGKKTKSMYIYYNPDQIVFLPFSADFILHCWRLLLCEHYYSRTANVLCVVVFTHDVRAHGKQNCREAHAKERKIEEQQKTYRSTERKKIHVINLHIFSLSFGTGKSSGRKTATAYSCFSSRSPPHTHVHPDKQFSSVPSNF